MKHTKKALLASVISMLLCCSMLIGSTFAWFTDSVTSGKNQIVAGNLDVELEYKLAKVDEDGHISPTGDWQKVDEDTDLFSSVEGAAKKGLWEPGHTEVVYLRVRNAGSLALKYRLSAASYGNAEGTMMEKTYTGTEVGADGKYKPFRLSDYIVFNVIDGEESYAGRGDLWIADADEEKSAIGNMAGIFGGETVLMPKDAEGDDPSEKIFTLAAYMPTWVGNVANQLTSARAEEGEPTVYFGLNLSATQATVESDSFGSDYDADAVIKVIDEGGLRDALANLSAGSTTVFQMENTTNLDSKTPLEIPEDCEVVLDLNGNNFNVAESDDRTGITVGAGSTLTITDTAEDSDGVLDLHATPVYDFEYDEDGNIIYFDDEGKLIHYPRKGADRERYGILLSGEEDNKAVLNIVDVTVKMDKSAESTAFIYADNAEVNIGDGAEIYSSSYGITLTNGSVANVMGDAKFHLDTDGSVFIAGQNYAGAGEERPEADSVVNFNSGTVTVTYADQSQVFQVCTDGVINMNGGTIEFVGDLGGRYWTQAFISNGGGVINMNGGTINASQTKGTVYVVSIGAGDSFAAYAYINEGATINLNSEGPSYAFVAQNGSVITVKKSANVTVTGSNQLSLTGTGGKVDFVD